VSELLPDLEALLAPLAERDAWVLGQLGQSLDGRIATASGHSHYINGPEDIRRLHATRALADAVVVGAGTVALDDPRLTVREAEGEHPVRVALDPRGDLPADRAIFTTADAPTLWIVGEGVATREDVEGDSVERVELPGSGAGFDPADVLDILRARGLQRVLVEGGGRTVSSFLAADLLDRLHLSVAPLLIGSGRPGITLPVIDRLDEARRPPVRHLRLGTDLLFDLDLRATD
jgi:riboflavin-specific deaminase-like protein